MTEHNEIDLLHWASEQGDIDQVRDLIAQGYSVHEFDDLAYTPLHYAVIQGHIDIIDELLSEGAQVNAHDPDRIGETPLGAVAANCSFEIAKKLIDAGADPTIPGWMMNTALDRAAKRKKPEGLKVHELLLKAKR